MKEYNIAIIGAGILGVSLAYILSIFTNKRIIVIEQEPQIAYHASSRNSGKVHAPFLYHPEKRKIFAKTAFLGFDMWEAYTRHKNLPFKKDGVLMVAIDDASIDRLELYMKWGEANGLSNDLALLDGNEVTKMEPEVRCIKAIHCKRDASTNYKLLTQELANDANNNGVTFLLNNKVEDIKDNMIKTRNYDIQTQFLINAAGGESLDIARKLNVARDFTNMYFRGEYWKAQAIYNTLTHVSVYSVPKFAEYPFLDPHWLVKVDGSCEVGPNAVPVFGPYAYNNIENLKALPSKFMEMFNSSIRKVLLDKQFIMLAKEELLSSLSKTIMINRVRRFLPKIKPQAFKERSNAGIRSMIIDKDGKFVTEPIIKFDNDALHILNYNSPGATGALPFAIYICILLQDKGIIKINNTQHRYWDLKHIIDNLT